MVLEILHDMQRTMTSGCRSRRRDVAAEAAAAAWTDVGVSITLTTEDETVCEPRPDNEGRNDGLAFDW